MTTKVCTKCRIEQDETEFYLNGKYNKDGTRRRHSVCRNCFNSTYRRGLLKAKDNPNCAQYLGREIALRILNPVFDNAIISLPPNTPGYKFLCPKGFKIQPVSATFNSHQGKQWIFQIRYNKIADYFLLMAFNSRDDLEPLHVWLIPAKELNMRKSASISINTLDRWSKYEKPVEKIAACCNSIKEVSAYLKDISD